VAQEILQTMGLRAFAPMVTACPGCGRHSSTVFQELAQSIQAHLRSRMPVWRGQYDGVENMTVAVMGCIVNGPGEASWQISASACREPARPHQRRCISMEKKR